MLAEMFTAGYGRDVLYVEWLVGWLLRQVLQLRFERCLFIEYLLQAVIKDGVLYLVGGFDGKRRNDVHKIDLNAVNSTNEFSCAVNPM